MQRTIRVAAHNNDALRRSQENELLRVWQGTALLPQTLCENGGTHLRHNH